MNASGRMVIGKKSLVYVLSVLAVLTLLFFRLCMIYVKTAVKSDARLFSAISKSLRMRR